MGQKMAIRKVSVMTLPDGMYCDGNGLYLRVRGGSRSWIYRFQEGGKKHDMGLGSAKLVSLTSARKAVMELKVQKANRRLGVLLNPKKAAPEVSPAFSDLAPEALSNYLNVRKIGPGRAKAIGVALRHCKPIGDKSVAKITRDDILALVRPLWSVANPKAKLMLWAINMVLAYAKSMGFVEGDLPSEWKGNLDAFLAPPSKEHTTIHMRSIPVADAPRVFQSLLADPRPACQCLVLGMSTALRVSEFSKVRWEYFDLDNAVLTVPRTKGKDRPFRVPLAPQIVEWLRGKQKDADRVFSVGNTSLQYALKELVPEATVHGIRSTFSMWCAETGVDPYVRETCLTHTVDKAVAAAYQRSDLLERRRPVMSAWVTFLLSASPQPGSP